MFSHDFSIGFLSENCVGVIGERVCTHKSPIGNRGDMITSGIIFVCI